MKRCALPYPFAANEVADRRFAHRERFFLEKLKPHLPVKIEGPSVFYHHADPQFIEAFFCGISFRCFQEPAAHPLSLKFREKIE
jgi:hypothetical protein